MKKQKLLFIALLGISFGCVQAMGMDYEKYWLDSNKTPSFEKSKKNAFIIGGAFMAGCYLTQTYINLKSKSKKEEDKGPSLLHRAFTSLRNLFGTKKSNDDNDEEKFERALINLAKLAQTSDESKDEKHSPMNVD